MRVLGLVAVVVCEAVGWLAVCGVLMMRWV